MAFRWLSLSPYLLMLPIQFGSAADPVNYNVTGYDTAPDLSQYAFDPFPPLKDEDGNQIDAENIRGTRLFGYYGCASGDVKIINEAYNDFGKLSHVNGLYSNIAWGDQAAKEMWGNDDDKKWPLPDERKE
ncbi:hypothetical protein BDW02DRAFT_126738 [Decorospora gaudefroyi]|uniref:Uncharacterized protein n=1 Tax=Decorospora gaudefroyi TaxID=184978 RepID=A0A6A5K544_9PLEO|nr:hypothetical protein BDW02DRAFT_126738 [Decorospora gaudefroyi]